MDISLPVLGLVVWMLGWLVDNQSRGSVFKWIGGGVAVGGLGGPIAALVGAVVAGTLLGRKYHEVIRLKRIHPIVEELDRRAASLDATL